MARPMIPPDTRPWAERIRNSYSVGSRIASWAETALGTAEACLAIEALANVLDGDLSLQLKEEAAYMQYLPPAEELTTADGESYQSEPGVLDGKALSLDEEMSRG